MICDFIKMKYVNYTYRRTYGVQPYIWSTALHTAIHMEYNLTYGVQPYIWSTGLHMEDSLKYGVQP